MDWHYFQIITVTCTLRCSRESFAATWCWAVTKIPAMAATVGDPVTMLSRAGVHPACPVPSATPCFDHTAPIFTLSFSSVLVDTRTVCQTYGHSQCLFVRLLDTCSAWQAYGHLKCLAGFWTLAVLGRLMDTWSAWQAYGHLQCLFVRVMDTHGACWSGLQTLAVFVGLMDICSACLSGWWTPLLLVRLMDTRRACQAYEHLQCSFVRLMDTCSACL